MSSLAPDTLLIKMSNRDGNHRPDHCSSTKTSLFAMGARRDVRPVSGNLTKIEGVWTQVFLFTTPSLADW